MGCKRTRGAHHSCLSSPHLCHYRARQPGERRGSNRRGGSRSSRPFPHTPAPSSTKSLSRFAARQGLRASLPGFAKAFWGMWSHWLAVNNFPLAFLPPGGSSAEVFISMQSLISLSIDVRSIYFYCSWRREKVRSLQSPFICMTLSSPQQPFLRLSPLSSQRKWETLKAWRLRKGGGSTSPSARGFSSLPPIFIHTHSHVPGWVSASPFKRFGGKRSRLCRSRVLALPVQGQ